MRIFLAGVLGGLALFVWLSVAHILTPLGETGIEEIPNEQAVTSALKGNITHSGMYLFPGWGLPPDATHSQKMEAMKNMAPKIAAGPTGILVFHQTGEVMTGRQLGTEFITNVVQIFLGAFLLAQTSIRRYISKLGFFLVLGIVAAISTNISYWNWYGFPASYTCAYIFTEVVGYLAAGLVVAAIVKRGAAQASAAGA